MVSKKGTSLYSPGATYLVGVRGKLIKGIRPIAVRALWGSTGAMRAPKPACSLGGLPGGGDISTEESELTRLSLGSGNYSRWKELCVQNAEGRVEGRACRTD